MSNIARTVGVLSVIALLVSSAAGQWQDARVQEGNLLDANPGVGTSGRNRGISSGRAIDSQLYISGRVSGLARFRGSRPYSPVGSLHLNLPGAGVRSFRRQSVGLQEATSGYAHRASPYLDRTQTVLGLRGIRSGLAMPGTNVPQYSTLTPRVANELYSTAVQRYEPLIVQRAPGQLLWQGRVQGPLAAPVVTGRSEGAPGRFEEAHRAGAGAIFALPWQDDREQLLAELNAIRRDRGAEAQVGAGPDDEQEDRRPSPLDVAQPSGMYEPSAATVRRDSQMPEPGRDAFHDLLMAIRMQEVAQAESTGDDRRDEEDEQARQAGSLITTAPSGLLVIKSLAGRNQDIFNGFMTEAQALMRAGRYYDAGVKFAAAATANPRNPFSQVGAAFAMFAAGEPVSSAYRLRRAMEIFPPIMETRMAVQGMMDAATFERRLAELDETLGEQTADDDQMLLLLAAYMHASAGQDDQAKAYAQRLEDVATDPLLAAYAKLVLTGKLPDEQSPEHQND